MPPPACGRQAAWCYSCGPFSGWAAGIAVLLAGAPPFSGESQPTIERLNVRANILTMSISLTCREPLLTDNLPASLCHALRMVLNRCLSRGAKR
jgi:hypothetical protein